MVKFEDFIIGGFLFSAAILGALIFVYDGATEIGIDITNVSTVNQTQLDELLSFTNESQSDLEAQDSGVLDSLADLFRKPISVAKKMGTATGILKDFITSVFFDLGIDPRFGYVIVGIMATIIIFLFIALLTGRFI